MKNTSNENLFTVIYFSAILDLKKEPPSKKKKLPFEKLAKRGNFLLFVKAILGENGQKWSIYGFLSERQKQRENKFDHGLISLYELKNHLRFVLCKRKL